MFMSMEIFIKVELEMRWKQKAGRGMDGHVNHDFDDDGDEERREKKRSHLQMLLFL